MWMHGAMPWMSRTATRAYYRVTVGGAEPPREGPALIVANHTNSLLDTAFVVRASQRRVRFMAKAPLFTYPGLGWLVKAVGSVPVYRRQDDPKLVAQNLDVFRDVYAAIAQGYALGIFPEGTSHSASHLQPLKTGAARIALGAAEQLGGRAFPIVPIGMMFSDRRTFRSAACVIVGASPQWDDLAGRGPKDREAARELTRRIETSMRAVTLNLHDWTDEQLVRLTEEIWRAEFASPDDPQAEMTRLASITKSLAQLRLGDDSTWRSVAREIRAHGRVLGRLGLSPVSLRTDVGTPGAVRWMIRQLPMLLMTPIAAIGLFLFWIPREITGAIGTKASKKEGDDSVPTFRVMYGGIIFAVWFLLLAILAGAATTWVLGIVAFFVLPTLALAAVAVGESGRFVWQSVRRWFVLRRHSDRVDSLRQRQRDLGQRLKELLPSS